MSSLPVSDVVRQLQTDLTALGFPCGTVDGQNGPATRTAVARFQTAYGHSRLTVDGQYGPQTLGAMSHARCYRSHVAKLYGERVPVKG
jgi:peptidoglycan hydrolase-like protein with peptidoglycan-binding domain